ncbi:PQQ-binding-like beta-propeller repeat protein [candidate division KSB1 bacterium]|nr:PQQ-binding-like beta-propeller repeat protein [candidate division KSB1 bacterium]RQW09119.1 MAG: hypothetical protein EH222_04450 [candidate division KSB1 bacterium]
MIKSAIIWPRKVMFCCLGITLISFAVPAQAADWPHYLGPTFNFKSERTSFDATSANRLWQTELETGMCSVTIVNGLLYTMGNDGTKENEDRAKDIVYCLDAGTGAIKWTFAYPCDLEPRLHPGGPSSTPTVHNGKVYTCSKFGHLHCLDAVTGAKIWEFSAEKFKPGGAWWGFAGSPTVMGDVVIYNIGERGLALNKNSGQVVWQSDEPVVAYATPWPLPSGLFSKPAIGLLTNAAFLVIDPATGKDIATYDKSWEEKSNCNAVTPYAIDGKIYLVHSAHGMARLSIDGTTLQQDWLSEEAKYPNEWFAFGTHVIHGDDIYFLTKDRRDEGTGLARIDAKTGARLSFSDQYLFGNLIGVGDKLIMLAEDGELIWGDLGEGEFVETFRQKILDGLCWANPVLLGDRLYARTAEGIVVCLLLK